MPNQCFTDSTGDGAINTVLFPALTLMAGCLTTMLLKKYSGSLRLQYTVLLLLLGIFLGTFSCIFDLGELEASFSYLVNMKPPELFFYIFLPPLLFEGASGLEWYYVKKSMGQIIFTAFILVMANTLATGIFVVYFLRVDWSLYTGLVFGALLSATDPVAVVAVLKSAGAPKPLRTVIEGESLLNDGSAFVLFEIFLKSVVNPSRGGDSNDGVLMDIFKETVHLTFGGIAIGVVFGMASTLIFARTFKEQQSTISMSLALTYLVFYVAAATFRVSGPIAVCAFGFFMSAVGLSYISPDVHEGLAVFWDVIAFVANTIVFVFSGIMGISIILDNWDELTILDWLYIPVIYIFLHILRFGGLWISAPLLNRMGYKITPSERIVMAAAGLRGALSLIMSLMIHSSMEGSPQYSQVVPRISLWTTGIAFMTLIINGSTIEGIMARVGVGKSNAAQERMFFLAKVSLREHTRTNLGALQSTSRLFRADWNTLYEYFGLDWYEDSTDDRNYPLTKSESERVLKGVAKSIKKMIPSEKKDINDGGVHSFMLSPRTRVDGNGSEIGDHPILKRGTSISMDENSLTLADDSNPDQDISMSFMEYFNKKSVGVGSGKKGKKKDDASDIQFMSSSIEVGGASNLQTERRKRLLFSLRVAIHKQFSNGLLKPEGLQILTNVINRSLDQAEVPLSMFEMMAGDVSSLNLFEKFLLQRSHRSINRLVMWLTFARLFRSYTTVAVYWSSLLLLKKDWPKGQVYTEIGKEVALAAEFLAHIHLYYPAVVRTVHTRLAALAVIRNQTKFIEQLTNKGLLESEAQVLIDETDSLEIGLSSKFTLASAFSPLEPEDLAGTIPFFRALSKEGFFKQVVSQGLTSGYNRGDEVITSGKQTEGIYISLQGNLFSKYDAYDSAPSTNATENDALIVDGLGIQERKFPVVGGIAGAYAALLGTRHQLTVYIESENAVVLFIGAQVVFDALAQCPQSKFEYYLVCAAQALNRLLPNVNFEFSGSNNPDTDEKIDVLGTDDLSLTDEIMSEASADVGALQTSEDIAVYLYQNLRKTMILSLKPHEKKMMDKSVVGIVLIGSMRSKVELPFNPAPALFSFSARTIEAGPAGAELLVF